MLFLGEDNTEWEPGFRDEHLEAFGHQMILIEFLSRDALQQPVRFHERPELGRLLPVDRRSADYAHGSGRSGDEVVRR